MGDHAHVYFILKIYLNISMNGRIGIMSYTFDIIVVSIGIIGFFQLVSILTFLVYSYTFFYVCMLRLQIVSISIGI